LLKAFQRLVGAPRTLVRILYAKVRYSLFLSTRDAQEPVRVSCQVILGL
jgi:hypothetical protein